MKLAKVLQGRKKSVVFSSQLIFISLFLNCYAQTSETKEDNPSRQDETCRSVTTNGFTPTEGMECFLQEVGEAPLEDKNAYGCHGQGIHFDGELFYTTCMDTYRDKKPYIYIHDTSGAKIRGEYGGSAWAHPSGILFYNGWAYTGFTSPLSGWGGYKSIFLRVKATEPVDILPPGENTKYDHSVGFVGVKFKDSKDSKFDINPMFYSYSQKYARECKDERCAAYHDTSSWKCQNRSVSNQLQDCDYYFEGGAWYKVCILFSSAPNKLRVWRGDEVCLTAKTALATVAMTGEPGHSGGLSFYIDPSNKRWIVTAPPPSENRRLCGGCEFLGIGTGKDVCACTDKKNRQRVRFHSFDNYQWPGVSN